MLYNMLLSLYEPLKQLYISNKMECFSYKGQCDVHGHAHIKALKEERIQVEEPFHTSI